MKEINESEANSSDENTQNSFQNIINSLQEDLQSKNTLLTNVTKERDHLQSDARKIRRANSNLKQQLEDERAFYLKEKEYYCKEMIVTKNYRKEQKEELKYVEELQDQIKEIDNLKKEISKLKIVLNDTLEANYNLSIKFLRMKNTKYTLKARLKREQTENAKIISDLSKKLEHTKNEINHIISDKFMMPIPPSNKKYLQVVKQNTQLIHGNLNYQVQISKLFNDIERIKAEKIKNETNLRLQYSRKLKSESKTNSHKNCEANLCDDSNKSIVLETEGKPSNSTISSSDKDFNLYSETQTYSEPHLYSETQSLCPKEAIRTKSAPEFRINEEATEENE